MRKTNRESELRYRSFVVGRQRDFMRDVNNARLWASEVAQPFHRLLFYHALFGPKMRTSNGFGIRAVR